MGSEPAIRIVVADDHPVVRGGLVALLRTIAGFEVIGEADDGESAVAAATAHRPDVVLMDIRMPGVDGLEATRRIREQAPDTRVLVLTMHDDDATVFTAVQAGAHGYLLKEAEQHDIVRAIRGVVAGEAIFGTGVASRVLSHVAGQPAVATTETPYPFPELTERERLVLGLLAEGKRNAEIAADLFLSPKTVSNHLTTIFAKLQVNGRGEAIARARDRGLAGPS
jgi:DNA-binding NarL/FixJ family response regulator